MVKCPRRCRRKQRFRGRRSLGDGINAGEEDCDEQHDKGDREDDWQVSHGRDLSVLVLDFQKFIHVLAEQDPAPVQSRLERGHRNV